MSDNEKLDWAPFALLLIDVQYDFWSERLAEHYPEFPSKVTKLLNTCRRVGIDIIHLRASFQANMSDWMPKYKLRGNIPCVVGTPGADVVPFAAEEPGESVIIKQTFDGFKNPDLLAYLLQKDKRFVLTAGLVTSTCVLFTTVSAAQTGFLTAVVQDCCADYPDWHEHTLGTYQFIFDRTSVAILAGDHHKWMTDLEQLVDC